MAHGRILNAWRGPRIERWTRRLMIAGAAALPFQNAATIEVGYTVRLSHVLFAAALGLGFPFAVRGWARVPRWLAWTALGLFVVYALATVLGDPATIAGTARGGESRGLIYLVDLILGLGVVGLVNGLWTRLDEVRPLVVAAVAGAAVGALYAVWQWPALHFDLPLSDILSTRDSNSLTTGAAQGAGLLGWERVRGTFLEPHFLGGFMASSVPLGLAVVAWADGPLRRGAQVATALMLVALLLSSSAPAWLELSVAILVAGAAWTIAAGRPRAAMAVAATAAAAILLVPIFIASPQVLGRATGRDAQALKATADFRTETWDTVRKIWSQRPATGYGAGQSSVQLALVRQGDRATGLNSAQGLWAAALVDAGVPGLGLWMVVWVGTIGLAILGVLRRPSFVTAALGAAVLAATFSALVATDRMDLRVWLLAGVATVASNTAFRRPSGPATCEPGGESTREPDDQPQPRTDGGPLQG